MRMYIPGTAGRTLGSGDLDSVLAFFSCDFGQISLTGAQFSYLFSCLKQEDWAR